LGTPALGSPALRTPALGTPALGTPTLNTPALGTPVLGTPALGTPVLGTPALYSPAQGTPAMGSTTFDTPVLGAPSLSAPALGAPALSAPTRLLKGVESRPIYAEVCWKYFRQRDSDLTTFYSEWLSGHPRVGVCEPAPTLLAGCCALSAEVPPALGRRTHNRFA
jgi:hypothetical protein